MANRFKNPHVYPRDGMHYIYCDICGRKIRSGDSVLLTGYHSDKKNLVVCPDDADITNPQEFIRSFRERQISNPKYIRSEGADSFQDNPNDDRVPSAPRFLEVVGASASGIELSWFGPDDAGSSAIIGYSVQRSTPCGATYSTIKANTGSPLTSYTDTTGSITENYGYQVAAINGAGTGGYSEEACYPPSFQAGGTYVTGESDNVVLSEDGNSFVIAEDE